MSKPIVKDLNELVDANIISAETARAIQQYYQGRELKKPNRFPVIVNVLGALLASLGIILVIAHNWDELGRFAKTFIAFLPLLLGQGLCAYTLLKQKHSAAWKETGAVVLFFGVAACISLVAQTYNISGSLNNFLLTWMLLVIPLVYIMPSSVTALLYVCGITWYACETGYFHYSSSTVPYYYIGLLALMVPYLYQSWKQKSNSNTFTWLAWLLTLSLTIVLAAFSNNSHDRYEWVFSAYIAMFCIFYLLGRSAVFEQKRLYANPLLSIGALGILFILFFWSFEGVWPDVFTSYNGDTRHTDFLHTPFFYLTIILLMAAAWLIISDYKRVYKIAFDPMGFSGFLLFILLSVAPYMYQFGAFMINLYILFIAIFFIRKGAIQDHLGILNFGLAIIALLAVFRFFDGQIPFVWRGLFFIATGAGFFVANYLMVKKRKELKG